MQRKDDFVREIQTGYNFKGKYITLGSAILDQEVVSDARINIPLKTMNRHGLIAGATGTGKTKTLQVLSEKLSDQGVSVLLMDIKGDISGIAAPGILNDKIKERHEKIGLPYEPQPFPVEFLSISSDKGLRCRATISEFGPVLLSKMLELNDTQSGVVSLLFKYCDDQNLPLLDLKDFKKAMQYVMNEGKDEIAEEYGVVSTTTIGTITRKIIELEQQGAELFFGERSFEIEDLIRTQQSGKGIISILRLTDIQDKPKLFSTFMLSLLSEIYSTLPEKGDAEKPELVLFIDEAHLIFSNASSALLDQIETIIKLIRSKGVGIYFCTQVPADIPESILSQLGLRIQHALRAVTANDRKKIKQAAENFPISQFYDTDTILTNLGIGEALVTVLNEKGIPTPLAATYLVAPASRMNILTEQEIDTIIHKSSLFEKYNEQIDRKSAHEILSDKITHFKSSESQKELETRNQGRRGYQEKDDPSFLETLSKNPLVKQIGRSLARELTRSLLGTMGLGGKRR